MNRVLTPKLGAYAGLAALGLIASLVLGFPELVAVAAPFALVAGAGLALAETPDPDVSLELERERAIEGDELTLLVRFTSAVPIEQLDVRLAIPKGLSLVDGENPVALRIAGGGEREREYRLSCDRWGSYVLGELGLVAHDRFRAYRYARSLDFKLPIKVYPRPEVSRTCCSRSRRRSSPATWLRARKGRGSSSPTCGSSCPATACGGSTGARARGAASCG